MLRLFTDVMIGEEVISTSGAKIIRIIHVTRVHTPAKHLISKLHLSVGIQLANG
jgi:hypothetical protein